MSPGQAKKMVLMGGKVNHFPNFPQRQEPHLQKFLPSLSEPSQPEYCGPTLGGRRKTDPYTLDLFCPNSLDLFSNNSLRFYSQFRETCSK